MQKQLITDQLIDSNKALIVVYKNKIKTENLNRVKVKLYEARINMCFKFIKSLQSLRQQEVQNVKDSYGDGLNAHRTNFCNRDDYFTQTFEQKGGEKK